MGYKIVIDNGKPYEVIATSESELIKILTEQYKESQSDEHPYFDIKVFNESDGEDISESQFITELIADIMSESESNKPKPKLKKCCICKQEINGYGNNAEPLKKGFCCDNCNIKFIIPTRIRATIK